MRNRSLSDASVRSHFSTPSSRRHVSRVRHESIKSRSSSSSDNPTGDVIQLSDDNTIVDPPDWPDRPLWQLTFLNMIVLGIEVCYAMETALVTPLLLQMGLPKSLYSLTWIISPSLGFVLNPVLGSTSDRCSCTWGRRRPFILILCMGIFAGFTLFLNGEDLGLLAGDTTSNHLIGLILTTVGVVILDFTADSCDSPSKSYMIDVCNLKDVGRGLNLRAVLGGLGSGAGYVVNSVDWKTNTIGRALGNQARVNFTFISIVCLICFTLTLISVREKPLVHTSFLRRELNKKVVKILDSKPALPVVSIIHKQLSYDSLVQTSIPDPTWVVNPSLNTQSTPTKHTQSDSASFSSSDASSWTRSSFSSVLSTENLESQSSSGEVSSEQTQPYQDESMSVRKLLMSVVQMPRELRRLCLNHFLGWSALLALFLFYTDYVGAVVCKGDPLSPKRTASRLRYEDGIKLGCWGMVVFSASVIIYAVVLQKLSTSISSRTAYVWGQTLYAVGTGLMAIFSDNIYVTLALNATSGIMFVTITTLPFGIVADYHRSYQDKQTLKRGLGTDVACLASVHFLAQIVVSAILGLIITAVGSKLVIVVFASGAAFLAALNSAIFVMYEVRIEKVLSKDPVDAESQPVVL